MPAAVLLAAGVLLLVGTVALLVRRARNPTWVRDAQLAQNASPVISLLLTGLGALWVVLFCTFGVVVLAAGDPMVGWAMICVAATGSAHVWVSVWIRRRPFS